MAEPFQQYEHLLYFIQFIGMYNEISMGQPRRVSKLAKCRSLEPFSFGQVPLRNEDQRVKVSGNVRPILKEFMKQDHQKVPDVSRQVGAIASQARLQRVKSDENLLRAPTTRQYEDIIEIYHSQNANLRKQNEYLLRELRKHKKNQDNLYMYIQQLRKEVSQLQDKDLIENYCMNSKAPSKQVISKLTVEERPTYWAKVTNSNKILTKQPSQETQRTKNDTFFSSGILGTEEDEEITQRQGHYSRQNMEELSHRFNTLMDQCSKQQNKKSRDALRKKLAETAEKMRQYRKQSSSKNI